MRTSSQSRHFSLHWLERPQAWLDHAQTFIGEWGGLVSHHQLLTLAKRAERQVGHSILWFAVNDESKSPLLIGAVLPGDRVALLIQSSRPDALNDDLVSFLKSKLQIRSVMGKRSDLARLGFKIKDDSSAILERQLAWGKRLSQFVNATSFKGHRGHDATAPHTLTSRRALEGDRSIVNRWSKVFANETGASVESTTFEAGEWMKRGRLIVFEISSEAPLAVGMAAFSGEYTDTKFGRSCRLSLLFVDPIYRGRGLGHSAVEAIEQEARIENANGLILYSDATSERAHRFYSSLGFKAADEWLEVESGFNVKTTG